MSRKACLRLENATDKAYLVYPPESREKKFWIPKSCCKHRSTLTQKVGEHALIELTVEDWWIGKNPNLDKYFS